MHTSRNETEMGEKDSEAPFRSIRYFSVLSVTNETNTTTSLAQRLVA